MVTRVLGPRRLSLIAAAAVSVLAAGGLAFSGATAQAASTMSVGPTADSYVNSSAASANYGTSVELRVDGSPTVHSYLRFDLLSLIHISEPTRLGMISYAVFC